MLKHHSRPFAVTEDELQNVEKFCAANQLDEIGRICAELRVLRAEYLQLSTANGKLRAMVEVLEHDPQRRYSKDLEMITTGGTNAPTLT